MIDDAIRPLSVWSGSFLSWKPLYTSAALSLFGTVLISLVSFENGYEYGFIFSGVFDLLTIFTGFLATFYIFVVTRGNRFLEKIKDAKTYEMMVKLLKFTILWSVLIILFTYILVIANFKNISSLSLEQLIIFVWVFNVALIATNFTRCVQQFATVTNPTNNSKP